MTTTDNTTQLPEADAAANVRADWRTVMEKVSYRAIIDNIPYLSFVALLCVLYISNNHKAISIEREIAKSTKKIEELHWQYQDTKTMLMHVKTETQVMRSAKDLGLNPSLFPAYTIKAEPVNSNTANEKSSLVAAIQ